MKMIYGFLIAALALIAPKAEAQFAKEKFVKQVHFAVTRCAAANQGISYSSPKCFGDVDVWAIPANTVIEKIYVVVDTAVAGATDVDLGDDDDADGFVDGSLSLTLGTAGAYSLNAKVAGAYLRVQTAGATDALDIDVVPNMKYYAAAGKEVKMDVTGAATGASRLRVVIEGYSVGAAL